MQTLFQWEENFSKFFQIQTKTLIRTVVNFISKETIVKNSHIIRNMRTRGPIAYEIIHGYVISVMLTKFRMNAMQYLALAKFLHFEFWFWYSFWFFPIYKSLQISSHPLRKTIYKFKKVQKLCVGDIWASGTCGCRGHVGEGDMWVLGTSGCRGHVCWGTFGCRGHV